MASTPPDIRSQLAALLPRLRRFGRTLTGRMEDADDLVQMALEKALNRTHQWAPGTRLDSWMFRIMQTTWIDEVRAQRRRDDVFLPEEAGEWMGHAPTEQLITALSVQKAMLKLSDDQRAVVGLVLVEGLSYAEASEVLGIPQGTLTSRLYRARETLQAALGDRA